MESTFLFENHEYMTREANISYYIPGMKRNFHIYMINKFIPAVGKCA